MSSFGGIELEVLQSSKLQMYSKYLEITSWVLKSDGIRGINLGGEGSERGNLREY